MHDTAWKVKEGRKRYLEREEEAASVVRFFTIYSLLLSLSNYLSHYTH